MSSKSVHDRLLFEVVREKSDTLDDDSYYDGDQQEPFQVNLVERMDCSIQCPPHWIEPVLQNKQTLVYPTSASISMKCPFYAKPAATTIWLKDGEIFSPELYDLVRRSNSLTRIYSNEFLFFSVF